MRYIAIQEKLKNMKAIEKELVKQVYSRTKGKRFVSGNKNLPSHLDFLTEVDFEVHKILSCEGELYAQIIYNDEAYDCTTLTLDDLKLKEVKI